MTDFLKDPTYIEHMNRSAQTLLREADEALKSGELEKALAHVVAARRQCSQSAFYQQNKEKFEYIEQLATERAR